MGPRSGSNGLDYALLPLGIAFHDDKQELQGAHGHDKTTQVIDSVVAEGALRLLAKWRGP